MQCAGSAPVGNRSFALYTTCKGPARYHVRARGSLQRVLLSLACSGFAFVMKRNIGIVFILGWLFFKESSVGRDSIFHKANQCLEKVEKLWENPPLHFLNIWFSNPRWIQTQPKRAAAQRWSRPSGKPLSIRSWRKALPPQTPCPALGFQSGAVLQVWHCFLGRIRLLSGNSNSRCPGKRITSGTALIREMKRVLVRSLNFFQAFYFIASVKVFTFCS